MPDFSLAEKWIIFQILTVIMKADLIEDSAEVEYLDRVFKDFGLSFNEFDHIEEVSFEELLREFSKFTAQEKQYAKKLFVGMAESDGYVHPQEKSLIELISNQ